MLWLTMKQGLIVIHRPGCHCSQMCWEYICALLHPAFLGSGHLNSSFHACRANPHRVIEIIFLRFYNYKWYKAYNLMYLNLEVSLINTRNWFCANIIKGTLKWSYKCSSIPSPWNSYLTFYLVMIKLMEDILHGQDMWYDKIESYKIS